MSQLDQVLIDASELVTPTEKEEEKLARVVSKISSRLEEAFSEASVVPEFRLGGSYAKGTWLKGSADIDYFLLYPVSYSREKLETEAIQFSTQAMKGYEINMRFAEHPYVEAFVKGVRVNLVPCYKVEQGDWQSAADRSPFHAEYIRAKYNEKLRLEARLLKLFVKSTGVYGAEVKIQGFSGYVCEVLTLKFGSFENVLKKLSVIPQGEVISIEDFDKDIASSFRSPLVILDPVDTTRNLGSAISVQNAAKLVMRGRKFLADPSIKDFFQQKPSVRKVSRTMAELLSRTIVVSFPIEKRSVDILWGQLGKSVSSLSSKLVQLGFDVLRYQAASDEKKECAFLFLLLEKEISRFQFRQGPEYFRGPDLEKYLEKNRDRHILSWVGEEGRIDSLTIREDSMTVISSALSKLLSESSNLESMGLSKKIREEISNRFRVQTGTVVVKSRSRKWLSDAVLSMLSEEPEFQ